jgi:uroporphyrinogen decarboxylase
MPQLRKDNMTEKERWEALLKRQPIDRVPFSLQSLGFSARNVGYPTCRVYDNPEKSFWAQVWSNEMYGATHYTWYLGGAFPAREFGGEVSMPEGEYAMAPSLLRPAVASEEDLEKLTLPDAKTAGVMPLFMKFCKLQEKHGYHIQMYVGGTLTRVGYICDVERLCRWMIKRPDLVHRLCRLETDFILEMNKYWLKTFGHERILGYSGSPTESNQIISPRLFEDFVLPYQREVYENARAMGVKHFFTHICGEQNLNLTYWSHFSHGDPGIISIGHEIDIATAANYFPNDIIYGNVDPTIIQYGKPWEVYEMARVCIEKGKKCPGGFILAPGCELPVNAPPYNVWMLTKAVYDFGWYC